MENQLNVITDYEEQKVMQSVLKAFRVFLVTETKLISILFSGNDEFVTLFTQLLLEKNCISVLVIKPDHFSYHQTLEQTPLVQENDVVVYFGNNEKILDLRFERSKVQNFIGTTEQSFY